MAIIHEGLVKVWLGVKQPLRRKQKVKDRRGFPACCFHSGEPVWQKDSARGNTGVCRDSGEMKTDNQMAPGCIQCISTLQTNKKRCVPTLLRHPDMLEIHTLETTRLQCDVVTAKKSLSYICIRNTTVYLATEVGKMRAHGR